MPGTNLTRAEAHDRAQLLTVDSYTIDLDLTTGEKTFASSTTIRFTCAVPGSSTFADLVDATISEIVLNGVTLNPDEVYADNRIRLENLHVENELLVRAACTYSRSGEGLHRFVDPADDRVYLYTQFEVPDARRVFTTFEQPDLKSVFTFNVTAPEHWKVVSNATTPAPESLGDGKAVWHFPTTMKMSTYFTALVAGEYHEVRDSYEGPHGTIPLGFFARHSKIEDFDTDDLIEITKQGFAFFEDAFNYPYPFGKYDQLFVPEYNMGAMENAGCVTFRDEYLPRSRQTQAFYEQRANTILHEMAHMWFGDLVTMKWWDDLWLNESFAEWAAHHASVQATRFTEAWTGFTNARKNWAYRQDQLPSTHPIAADNYDLEAVEGNFDGITYAKGASSLKQLVAWVGEEPFLRGLSSYFHQHAFDNAEFGDLLAALTEASGRELDSWATEWLTTSGVNTLSADFEVDEAGAFTRFAVNQTAMPAPHDIDGPTLRRHRIRVGLYDRVAGEGGGDRLVRRTFVETDIAGASTEIAELVGQAQPDLVLLNEGDLTYAKIRLDERSLATLIGSIATLDDSLARALCWGAAWDMTRDAELAASDFVALVLAGVGSESDITAVQALLSYARSSADSYSAPANRAALRATWENGVRTLLEGAEAGSDHQLAFARSFAAAAHTPAGLDLVQALYDGTVLLPGLEVNQDLRWTFLHALAAGGRADEAAIDGELGRDNTISGQEKAAGARTAIPTAEAKAWAWQAAVLGNDLPNETMRQVCASFQTPGQEELLAPYVAQYLDVAETIIETKGVWIARVNLELTFPRAIPTPETLDAVTAWLEQTDANPAAVRYVREGHADLVRALAAQAKDAE